MTIDIPDFFIDKYNFFINNIDLFKNITIGVLFLICIWLIYLNGKKNHFLFLTKVKIGLPGNYFIWELNKDELFKKMLEENLELKRENEILENKYMKLGVGSAISLILVIVAIVISGRKNKLDKKYDSLLAYKEKPETDDDKIKKTIADSLKGKYHKKN